MHHVRLGLSPRDVLEPFGWPLKMICKPNSLGPPYVRLLAIMDVRKLLLASMSGSGNLSPRLPAWLSC